MMLSTLCLCGHLTTDLTYTPVTCPTCGSEEIYVLNDDPSSLRTCNYFEVKFTDKDESILVYACVHARDLMDFHRKYANIFPDAEICIESSLMHQPIPSWTHRIRFSSNHDNIKDVLFMTKFTDSDIFTHSIMDSTKKGKVFGRIGIDLGKVNPALDSIQPAYVSYQLMRLSQIPITDHSIYTETSLGSVLWQFDYSITSPHQSSPFVTEIFAIIHRAIRKMLARQMQGEFLNHYLHPVDPLIHLLS